MSSNNKIACFFVKLKELLVYLSTTNQLINSFAIT